MQKGAQSVVVMTPEEERELKFPVRIEQPPTSNFTTLQIAVLLLQVCLAGVLCVGIVANDSNQKVVSSPQTITVLTVERERKVGGGYKYSLISENKDGIEAILLGILASNDVLTSTDEAEVKEHTTTMGYPTTSSPPLRLNTRDQNVPVPPQETVTSEHPVTSTPDPPRSFSLASSRFSLRSRHPIQQRTKEIPTTRKSIKFSHRRNDFHRG